MRLPLTAALLTALCLGMTPALAEEHAVANEHAVAAEGHGETTHASADAHATDDHGHCDAASQAKDEMRRRTNAIVAFAMAPRPGCPAFADLDPPAEESEAVAEAAPAKSGGH